ncbi:MAG: aminopeptidase P family protein, partial [Pedobacter sp.]
MTYKEKLSEIRKQMKADQVEAYIIPSADPHISEYLPKYYKCIPFTSGFKGSAGTLVITHDFAGLWTDFRYFEQATEELAESGFELVKQKVQHAPEYIQWLGEKLHAGAIVAADEQLLSILLGDLLTDKLGAKGISLTNKDYLAPIWSDRPALPTESAFLLADTHVGQSVTEKLTSIRASMNEVGAKWHLVSSLDDMAWIFNIRGKDVNYNPVVLSFALISADQATLFIDLTKLDDASKEALEQAGITLAPYTSIEQALTAIPEDASI